MAELLFTAIRITSLYLKSIFTEIYEKLFLTREEKSISGKVALVTGGANGLGRAICFQLAEKGCKVAIVDVDEKNGTRTATETGFLGVKAKFYRIDVSDFKAIQEVKAKIEKDLGPVDLLINNAAILFTPTFAESSPELLQKFMNVNLMAHFWTVKTFLPGMIERKSGHLVAIASIGALVPVPGEIAYTTSKFGIRGFMKALQLQLRIDGTEEFIKTSCVYPYLVRTRRDLVETWNSSMKIKSLHSNLTLQTKVAAKMIVSDVLKEKTEIVVPSFFSFALWAYLPLIFLKWLSDMTFDREANLASKSKIKTDIRDLSARDKSPNPARSQSYTNGDSIHSPGHPVALKPQKTMFL